MAFFHVCTRVQDRNRTRKTPSTGTCRAWHCAGQTSRQRLPPSTMTMPGNPRRRRREHLFPFASRPPFAQSAWLQFSPFCSSTTLIARRWDAMGGPERRASGTTLWTVTAAETPAVTLADTSHPMSRLEACSTTLQQTPCSAMVVGVGFQPALQTPTGIENATTQSENSQSTPRQLSIAMSWRFLR